MEMSLETDWPDKLFGIWFDELVFDIDANDKEIPQILNKINFEDNLPPFFFSILDLWAFIFYACLFLNIKN